LFLLFLTVKNYFTKKKIVYLCIFFELIIIFETNQKKQKFKKFLLSNQFFEDNDRRECWNMRITNNLLFVISN
jgi:hypothetical protein